MRQFQLPPKFCLTPLPIRVEFQAIKLIHYSMKLIPQQPGVLSLVLSSGSFVSVLSHGIWNVGS